MDDFNYSSADAGESKHHFNFIFWWNEKPADDTVAPDYQNTNHVDIQVTPIPAAQKTAIAAFDGVSTFDDPEEIFDFEGHVDDALDDLSDLAEEGVGWLYENEWVIGVIYLIIGPLVAIFGARWFPYIIASLIAMFVLVLICMLGLSFGWMESVGASIAICLVGLALGIVAGCLVRRNFKVMLGLLGLIAGFFGGTLLYALISGMAGGWNAVWAFWVFACIMAIVGCVLAIYLGMPLVMISTSLVGSYLFMRAWTMFFPGNYPNEHELIENKGSDLDMGGIFWVFIGVFIVSFLVSLYWQCKHSKRHADLDDHFGKDDEFRRA